MSTAQFPRMRVALCALCLTACDAAPTGETGLRVRRLPQSTGGCATQAPLDGLLDEVDRLFVEIVGDDGRPTLRPALQRGEDDLGAGEVLLEEVPVGERARIQLYACTATGLGYFGASAPFALGENEKVSASVVLRPVEKFSCAGSGLGPEYDTFARLGRARAFPSVATLRDGRLFIGGGASKLTATGLSAGGLLIAELGGADYDSFDAQNALFPPSMNRAWEDAGARLLQPRVAGAAFPVGTDEAPAILIVGGHREVSWAPGKFGPLGLLTPILSPPFIERLDVTTETASPVRSSLAQSLVPRFLPATAQDPVSGTVAIVGGLEVSPVLAPSVWVDLIAGDRIRSFPLGTPRIGASVTALGEDRFLIWGGDVDDCGASPAVLIDARLPAPVRPLAVEATMGPPACGVSTAGRTWWVTSWHAATRIGADPLAGYTVLVSGGMEVLQGAVEQTPEIGSPGSPPNFIRLNIPPTMDRVAVLPLDVPLPVAPLLRRALHGALLLRDRVFIGGGWSAGADGTLDLNALAEVVAIRLEYGTLLPTAYEIGPTLTLSEPRLGPAMTPTSEGALLFAGGVRREGLGFVVSDTAELFVPLPASNPCVAGAAPSTFDLGTSTSDEFGLPLPLGDGSLDVGPALPDALRFDAF